MSWAFGILLAAYCLLRWTLWTHGQMRYLALPKSAEPPLAIRPTPVHLSDEMSRIFVDCERLAVRTDHYARTIHRVLFVDPDAPLGGVRHGSYRLAILETWRGLKALQRTIGGIDADLGQSLSDQGITPDTFERLADDFARLAGKARLARALDPFPRKDVERGLELLRAISREARRCADIIHSPNADPYRGASRQRPRGPVSALPALVALSASNRADPVEA